jgi:NTE family protein
MGRHGIESKLNPDWDFLTHLRDAGRATASKWLDASYEDIGRRTTVNLVDTYL